MLQLALATVHLSDAGDLAFIRLPKQKESFVGLAVERVAIDQRLQPRDRSGIRSAKIIETSYAIFTFRNHLLHLQQLLLGLGNHLLVVGILQDYLPVLLLGTDRMSEVAVGLFHLLKMNVGDLYLRLSRFRHVGEESFEVLIFLLGLCQRRSAALRVPRIRQRQLGARDELGIRLGVDQGLHVETRDVEVVVLHRVHAAIEQHLVRLLGVNLSQRIADLFIGAGSRERQRRGQSNHGSSGRQMHENLERKWSVVSYISDQLQMIRAGHRERFVLQLATNHCFSHF